MIQRYSHCACDDGDGLMDEWDEEDDEGEWVRYKDVAHLIEEEENRFDDGLPEEWSSAEIDELEYLIDRWKKTNPRIQLFFGFDAFIDWARQESKRARLSKDE